MQTSNPMLEIKLQPTDGLPLFTLKKGEDNTFRFLVKNNSGKNLLFESEHGVAATKGSTETNKSTTLFLCFGNLLSIEEVEAIEFDMTGWEKTIEIQEKKGKVFNYIRLVPKETTSFDKNRTIRFELKIHPKSQGRFTYLTLEIDHLKVAEDRSIVATSETSFSFPIRTWEKQEILNLKSGIVGDDCIYVSKNGSIQNVFTVYFINSGGKIDFSLGNSPKLRIKLGKGFDASALNVNGKNRDTTGGYVELDLSGVWESGHIREFKFTCTMNQVTWSDDQNYLITNLTVETLGFPVVNNRMFYIPMKLTRQKQIGSESLSLKINHESIHIQ